MKTVSDLYEEIDVVNSKNLVLAIQYFNQVDDPFHYPRTFIHGPMLTVVSLEFKPDIEHSVVERVYDYIKKTYSHVLFDVRLVTYTRIHIYVQAHLP